MFLSADSRYLVRCALAGLDIIYLPGFNYKKAGVLLMGIGPEVIHQTHFLQDERRTERDAKLMGVIDKINRIHGKDSLLVASSGIHKSWSMKREKCSPRYTTNRDDLPKAHAC